MDPNLPQASSPPLSPQPKPKRNIIVTTCIIVIIIIFASFLFYSRVLFKKEPVQNTQEIQKPPTPTPTSIVLPVNLETINRGIITKIVNNSLTIKTATSSAIFDISQTKDFQKLVSGTLAGGDAKTASSSAKELKVNQEVLVITIINEPIYATTVLIIK